MNTHVITIKLDKPAVINWNSKELDHFIENLHKSSPETSFLTAENIRIVIEFVAGTLLRLKLPAKSHRGAKIMHVEKGGDPDQLVRPTAELEIVCADFWTLKKITFRNRFVFEPFPQGLTLTSSQQATILRADISEMLPRDKPSSTASRIAEGNG